MKHPPRVLSVLLSHFRSHSWNTGLEIFGRHVAAPRLVLRQKSCRRFPDSDLQTRSGAIQMLLLSHLSLDFLSPSNTQGVGCGSLVLISKVKNKLGCWCFLIREIGCCTKPQIQNSCLKPLALSHCWATGFEHEFWICGAVRTALL